MMMSGAESTEAAELKAENEKLKKMMQVMQEKLAQVIAGKSQLSEETEGTIKESGT